MKPIIYDEKAITINQYLTLLGVLQKYEDKLPHTLDELRILLDNNSSNDINALWDYCLSDKDQVLSEFLIKVTDSNDERLFELPNSIAKYLSTYNKTNTIVDTIMELYKENDVCMVMLLHTTSLDELGIYGKEIGCSLADVAADYEWIYQICVNVTNLSGEDNYEEDEDDEDEECESYEGRKGYIGYVL